MYRGGDNDAEIVLRLQPIQIINASNESFDSESLAMNRYDLDDDDQSEFAGSEFVES